MSTFIRPSLTRRLRLQTGMLEMDGEHDFLVSDIVSIVVNHDANTASIQCTDGAEITCPLSPPAVCEKFCAICKKENARRCTNCKQISYCGKEHQVEHWKIHKENCFPIKVVERSTLSDPDSRNLRGRSETHVLVSTRDINAGETFLRENAILTAPGPCDEDSVEVAKGRPVCVSCCEIIRAHCELDDDDEDSTTRCSHCHWPVCNHTCESNKRHADFECKILASNSVSSMVLNQMPDYECILVLRAILLKKENPEKWMKLLNLDAPIIDCMDNDMASVYLNSAVKFIREKCGLKQFSDNLIRQVASIVYINSFFSEDHPGDSGYSYKLATYIGDISSKVAHSCLANSEWVVVPETGVDDQFRFRALVPIKAGEVITIMYNRKSICHEGTLKRQNLLMNQFFFTCSCKRCLDPNEFGTFVSGIKCPVYTCDGYLLPLEPTNFHSVWTCNSNTCEMIETNAWAQKIVNGVSSKIGHFPYKDPMRALAKNMVETKKFIGVLKKQVGKYSQTYLHPNHSLILNAEWKILQNCYYFVMNVRRWSPDVVDLMISIGKKHLNIFDKLAPGMSRRRGYILYFLQTGLFETIRQRTKELTRELKDNSNALAEQEPLKEAYAEMMKIRDESVTIFTFTGQVKNSVEEELLNFSAPDQPFMSCLMKFFERILDHRKLNLNPR